MNDDFAKAMTADRASEGDKKPCDCPLCTGKAKAVIGIIGGKPRTEDFLEAIAPEVNRFIVEGEDLLVVDRDVMSDGGVCLKFATTNGQVLEYEFEPEDYKILGQLALFLKQTSQQMAAMKALPEAEAAAERIDREMKLRNIALGFAKQRVDNLKQVAGL